MTFHPALAYCLSMISAQTLRVCREGKPAPTFPDHALAVRERSYFTSWLFDDLHDAARARLDQHGLAVHDRIAVGHDAKRLRHVVIGHAGFPQHAPANPPLGNRVILPPSPHDVSTNPR